MAEPVRVYTSRFCMHSWSVERFLKANDIPAEYINIDEDSAAREKVMAMNRGYASVPTLVFADGSQLTEPSMRELRAKLDLEAPSLRSWVNDVLGR